VSGLITSTLQLCAAFVKMGLITIWVALSEPIVRLAKVSPLVLSRSVTLALATKPVPVMVNGCALSEPTGDAGLTPVMVGAGDDVWKYKAVVNNDSPELFPAATFQRYCLPAVRLAI